MAIEIVDFPIKNGGSFHSYVNVYQRVYIYIADIIPNNQTKPALHWTLFTCQFLGTSQSIIGWYWIYGEETNKKNTRKTYHALGQLHS